MSKLENLLQILEEQIDDKTIYNYVVPDLWNCFDYDGEELKYTNWGELMVNPYRFYSYVIKNYILKDMNDNTKYNTPLSKLLKINKTKIKSMKNYSGGDWIKKSTVYSTMIRTSTSWDHDRSGDLENSNIYNLKDTGTFVKSLSILPLLKKMGIDTVYMLPISKFSLKDKKGELGSPYGVSNFFEIDPSLKDPITKEHMTVEDEFKAFVEACHILDMRIMIDIIPRTNSVNSDLIAEHPDWFYWIKLSDLEDYFPPFVPGLPNTLSPKPEYLPKVYESQEVWDHINKFVVNPRDKFPDKWEKAISKWKSEKSETHILDIVRKEFGLTVAPAFSDHINDVQPPWTDVTFFRMYLDHPVESQKYLGDNKDVAPYILFDTIKSNYYQGNEINQELWDTLSDIIPYYQNNFGIDGARIDMGHALPKELVDLIISKARKVDPDFCFIAEELDPEKAAVSKEMGYNMIIGKGYYMTPRIWDFSAHEFYYSSANLACPVFAGGETHDTPRLAAREQGGRPLAKMLSILNMFMPNGVPFINSGQEVYETQPMNTGLDCRDNEAYMLDPNDQYNGRLALFDKFAFHYLNPGRWELPDILEAVSKIRKDYIDTIANLDNFIPLGFNSMRETAVGFGYIVEGMKGNENDNLLLVVANTDVFNQKTIHVKLDDIRFKSGNNSRLGTLLYSPNQWHYEIRDFDNHGNLNLNMQPGEVKIIKL